MADIKTVALPIPSSEYDSVDEAVTRRVIAVSYTHLTLPTILRV